MIITRNRQQVSFATDHADADIVQTSQFLNSAQMVLPLHDYLIDGVHVVASTGPLARHAIREHKARAAAAAAAAPTYHPGRCYCAVFAGGHHVPGMTQPGAYGTQCKGDRVAPHDASSCGACKAGALDFQADIEPVSTTRVPAGTTYHLDSNVDGAWSTLVLTKMEGARWTMTDGDHTKYPDLFHGARTVESRALHALAARVAKTYWRTH